MPPHIFGVDFQADFKVSLSVAAGLGASLQVQRDPGLASGVL